MPKPAHAWRLAVWGHGPWTPRVSTAAQVRVGRVLLTDVRLNMPVSRAQVFKLACRRCSTCWGHVTIPRPCTQHGNISDVHGALPQHVCQGTHLPSQMDLQRYASASTYMVSS